MPTYQVVARIDTPTANYNATRVYYPQHPANAVEFDEATTGNRMMLFGPCTVMHYAVDTSPKAPFVTAQVYYTFWLGWLIIAIVGGIYIARILSP